MQVYHSHVQSFQIFNQVKIYEVISVLNAIKDKKIGVKLQWKQQDFLNMLGNPVGNENLPQVALLSIGLSCVSIYEYKHRKVFLIFQDEKQIQSTRNVETLNGFEMWPSFYGTKVYADQISAVSIARQWLDKYTMLERANSQKYFTPQV